MALAIVYALFLLYAVLRIFRRPTTSVLDYIVAGRRLTLPAFVATLVTTWYGGILGVGEYTWKYGISNWLVLGVPYYLCAALFAIFIAGRARRSQVLTVPDQLERRYGRGAALIGAAVLFVMTAPSAYVLMLGVLMQVATGWPLWAGVVLGTALSVGYVFRGGLRAIVLTDQVQFVLMFVGFVVLVPVCVVKYGGIDFLRTNLPADHLVWDGGRGTQAVAVWYFIALATLVEPAFYQRCYAAQTERTARVGIFVAIVFWIGFDFLTTTAGLYARAVLPDLTDPITAFPRLAEAALPSFWQALFFVGLLATIMSTVDSYAFIGGVTLGRDLWGRWRAPRVRREQRVTPVGRVTDDSTGDLGPLDTREAFDNLDNLDTEPQAEGLVAIRWGLLLTALLAIGLALTARSVVGLWHDLGSVGTPVLLLPLALAHTSLRISGRSVAAAMLLSGATALSWLVAGGGQPFLGVEAIFPGLAVSVLVLLPAVIRRNGSGRESTTKV
jgi:SSS family solute:Na+ symporter